MISILFIYLHLKNYNINFITSENLPMKKALKRIGVVLLLLVATVVISYFIIKIEPTPSYTPERNYIENKENEILAKFLTAKDSSVIELEEGHFKLSQSLSLDGVSNIIIRGKGIDKTILSFKDQKKGAEGIRVSNCKNITIENLTVEDAKGDNIKFMDTDGIIMQYVQSSWTGKVSSKNGAYAFYPVLSKNIVIDHCRSIGSSDAGIYVGQSDSVVISNNEVFYNVAGIESENSKNVKIFNNEVYENVSGILIFDLPMLTQYGKNIEVYNNNVYNNNIKSFAPKGSIVGQVPTGTGSIVLATNQVNFHDNTFTDNKTLGIAVLSYKLIYELGKNEAENDPSYNEDGEAIGVRRHNENYKNDKNYDPDPRNVTIGSNNYENSYWFPTLNNVFGEIMLFKSAFTYRHVVWDGIKEEGVGNTSIICFKEDVSEDMSFLMLDVINDFENITSDVSKFKCK